MNYSCVTLSHSRKETHSMEIGNQTNVVDVILAYAVSAAVGTSLSFFGF